MERFFKEPGAKAEVSELDNGTTLVKIPISRRFPLLALLIGIFAFPVFLFGFLNSGEIVWVPFAWLWLAWVFLFFLVWFSFSLSYFFSHKKYSLQVDEHGIREQMFGSKRVLSWKDIVKIGIYSYGEGEARVGFLLKKKSWSRWMRLSSFDAVLLNQYGLQNHEIARILKDCQLQYSEVSLEENKTVG